MNNRRIIIIAAAALIAIGTPLPLIGAFYLSWTRTLDTEKAELRQIGRQVIERARQSFDMTSKALHSFDKTVGPPCSPDHIGAMRTMTVNTRTIVEIGYFENKVLKCSSWGLTTRSLGQVKPDFITPDGVAVRLNVPSINGGRPMMIMQYGAYSALVDPVSFADVLVDPAIRLAVATEQGYLLGMLNDPDRKLMLDILAEQPETMRDESRLVSLTRGDNLAAIVMEPRSHVLAKLRKQQSYLIPLGFLASLLILFTVLRKTRRRLSPVGLLKSAIQRREFKVHYQPLIHLASGSCVGGEALIRWPQGDGSMIPPDKFIPLAEKHGLIQAITSQVVDQVMADMAPALRADRTIHVAINMSAQDLKCGSIIDVIHQALQGTDVLPQQIWLEATERGFMEVGAASATLNRAREAGHMVAIDDFGTGYSSLSYLKDLPLDALKVDKSFIDTIASDSSVTGVTACIINMAKSLKLTVIAEGIENEGQAAYLRASGVEFGQGWLFAKAMPAEEFIAFCKAHPTVGTAVADTVAKPAPAPSRADADMAAA